VDKPGFTNDQKTMRDISNLTLSIIVPAHRGGEKLLHCLTSLAKVDPPPDEIIVVVDGASADVCRLARKYGAQVVALPVCGGPARARNVGADTARGDLLYFVDSDVAVPPQVVRQILYVFQQTPGLCALIGSYDDAPVETNFLSQYRNLLHHYVHQSSADIASTFWGACGVIWRDVFQTMGGFDEHYTKASIEDIELGYRLVSAGFKIHLCKSLQVKHLKRWDLVSMLRTDFYQRALPWTELIWRHRRLVNDLNVNRSSQLSGLIVFILLLLFPASLWRPALALLEVGAVVLLLWLNLDLYRFFLRKRGAWFALKAIPCHWLYYFYSGLAFAMGTLNFLRRSRQVPPMLATFRLGDT
jgi:GT2 family glycosyltransferase